MVRARPMEVESVAAAAVMVRARPMEVESVAAAAATVEVNPEESPEKQVEVVLMMDHHAEKRCQD